MKATEVGLLDEVFTHLGGEGVQTSYAVTRLYERCQQGDIPIARVPVEHEHAAYCVSNRGVEKERLEELVRNPEWLAKPIMFIEMPDGSHLLVDGTHRYVVFFGIGMTEIRAYMIPWAVAAPFVVEDMPETTEERLMQHSHLTLLRKLFGEGGQ